MTLDASRWMIGLVHPKSNLNIRIGSLVVLLISVQYPVDELNKSPRATLSRVSVPGHLVLSHFGTRAQRRSVLSLD